MPKTEETFLQILNEYFSKLQDEQIVAGRKEKITIPMEWLFTDKIDRAVIEKAFINLICKANKEYKSKLSKDRNFYGKISSLEIERTDLGANLVINARDSWTKIVVTDNKNLRGPFYAISQDRLYQEILTVYDYKSLGEICKEFNLSMDEREQFIKRLKAPEVSKQRKEIVAGQMAQAAENLIGYYDYMSKKKTQYEASDIVIQQRKGKGVKGAIKGGITAPRKSEIFDFEERDQIYQQMRPYRIINVNNIEEDNTISKFSYVVYVYKNPREKQGYLFAAEPFEGTHKTRMRFVTKEEYDKLRIVEGKSKLDSITERFMEMSDEEFIDTPFSKAFNHTDIERYRTRLRRIIQGAPTTDRSLEAQCAEADKILFNGERRKTRSQIINIGRSSTPSKANEARGWLYGRQIEMGETTHLPQ